jgi:uncharacterized Zn-finger protein
MYKIFFQKNGKAECYPYITTINTWSHNFNFLKCTTGTGMEYIIPIHNISHIIHDAPITEH